jgi:uncharacterized membrane protein
VSAELAALGLSGLAGAVVLMLGGSFFMRFILLPVATATLDASKHTELRERLMARWRPFVHGCIGLLLLSGTWNLIQAMKAKPDPIYHTIFGIKFLLALIIFWLVIMLTSSRDIAWIKNHRRRWMSLLVALGIGVIFLSMMLKNLPRQL